MASVIGATEKEIIFTSVTESNNMAIKGIANFINRAEDDVITTRNGTQVRLGFVQAFATKRV